MPKLVDKILTLEFFQRDYSVKPFWRGSVYVRVRGWDEAEEFLKANGSQLIRGVSTEGFNYIRMPEGWDSHCVDMENIFE